MRKLLLTTCLAFSLAGCGNQSILTGGNCITCDIPNVITMDELYKAENGLIVVEVGMNTYKSLCREGVIPDSCEGILIKLKKYNKIGRTLLKSVRSFVKQNDQINAVIVFGQLKQLILQLQGEATAAGVQI